VGRLQSVALHLQGRQAVPQPKVLVLHQGPQAARCKGHVGGPQAVQNLVQLPVQVVVVHRPPGHAGVGVDRGPHVPVVASSPSA
jgi:hypothetical protein